MRRPLATGYTFVCQAAEADKMVVCIDSESGIMARFGNITGIQDIV